MIGITACLKAIFDSINSFVYYVADKNENKKIMQIMPLHALNKMDRFFRKSHSIHFPVTTTFPNKNLLLGVVQIKVI